MLLKDLTKENLNKISTLIDNMYIDKAFLAIFEKWFETRLPKDQFERNRTTSIYTDGLINSQHGGGNPALGFLYDLKTRYATFPLKDLMLISIKHRDYRFSDTVQRYIDSGCATLKDLSTVALEHIASQCQSRGPFFDWMYIADEFHYNHDQKKTFENMIYEPNIYSPTTALINLIIKTCEDSTLEEFADHCKALNFYNVFNTIQNIIENDNKQHNLQAL